MKNRFSLRIGLMALAGVMALGFGLNTASADSFSIGIRVGGPPPRYCYDSRPYPQPYPGYVWVPGYQEWRGGRYVWVNGYYARPPHRGAVWIPARYSHHHGGYYYQRGYWR